MDIYLLYITLTMFIIASDGRPKAVHTNDVDALDHHKMGSDEVINMGAFRPSHGIKVSELQPPDHLEAVRLEQDGHLNRDYLQEVFLGHDHEDIEDEDDDVVKAKLTEIYKKVNSNNDSHVDETELSTWIIKKVQEHFKDAEQQNGRVFSLLDSDNDGFITWREFHVQFLVSQGHSEQSAIQQASDYEAIPLEAQDKELLIRHKFKWSEADNNPEDNRLSKEEFHSFQHPEQSPIMMLRMVTDILESLDDDGNGELSPEEFASLPVDDSIEDDWQDSDRRWKEERKEEFREVIDLDKDGRVTQDELLKYVDPQNPIHALIEAKNLVELADDNNNGELSLKEVLDNAELFLGSKMVDTERNFHDEF